MGLLEKVFGKKRKETAGKPNEEGIIKTGNVEEITKKMTTRLNDAYNKDAKTKTFLEGEGYNPKRIYEPEELAYFLTVYGEHLMQETAGKHKKPKYTAGGA
jgi:hypothetical protein